MFATRNELENGIVYIVNDYSERDNVAKDLEEGHRVVVISDESDVLTFYGAILQSFGQFNLYLEKDLSDVDEEYLEQASNRDVPKDEAAIYVGKTLSELVVETINELELNQKQLRIMAMVKELLKHNTDIKQDATISLLNDKLRQERAEKENLINELNEIKLGQQELGLSIDYSKTTINLDNFTSPTQVMYIKCYESVSYLDTCIRAYVNQLRIKEKKKVKLVYFDDKLFDILHQNSVKINSQDYYLANKNQVFNNPVITSKQLYPLLVQELYKSGQDLLIFVDKILNNTDLVKGKNVHKYTTASTSEVLNYLINSTRQDFCYITAQALGYKKGIVLGEIKQDISTPEKQLYWYSKLENAGEDNSLVFDIFNKLNFSVAKR